ncbi:MAG: Mg2+/Co2+ transporter [Deltaproteobacteria bacterium HGW-Deltaproteobacteria-12]|jgi:magnesium transporter|nr:MAG: Mg2+/Co2+ transporter [Deltaproteobacteria bacterium HGW-Deltaproteobacteria-12]
MSESKFYHISQKGKLTSVINVDAAVAAAKSGGFFWLNYCQPKKEELLILISLLDLHLLSIEDCLDKNQIPKIEDFPRNTFIIFNTFEYSNKKLSIGEIDLFIGDNFLVTVSQRKSDNRRVLDGIEHIMETDMESARHGPAFLMHVILDNVVDQKFLAIEALEDELDIQEETMLASVSNFNPAEMIRLRRDLLNLRKSLFHEREILVKICRKDCHFIPDKAIYHYRDIYDHLTKFFELTESYREIVTSLMEMYLSMLNNQMTKVANETNLTVRRLTLITTIFMPLTLLAGIGGMSEWSMMTGSANWKIAYPAFLLAMVVIGFTNYCLIKWYEKKK